MYERLTDKNDLYWALQETKLSAEVGIYLTDCLNLLAELEDKIENVTLIELPCKVGDTIFFEGFRNGSESIGILEHKVVGFSLKVLTKGKDDIVPTDISIKDFGKDVLFTKEELKNYLKELSK